MFDFDNVPNRRGTSSLKWDVKDGELPMWVADMDFPAPPCIRDAVIKRAEHGIFGYNVVPEEWYDSVINWWSSRHGIRYEKEWLQFSTGIVPAISSMIKRLCNVGDNVVVLTPVYDIFFHSIENFGRHTLESKLRYKDGRYDIDFDDLERALSDPLSTVMILCNPHNPIGKIWNRSELDSIGKLCYKYGVTVISDEIHCDITTPGKEYTPFAAVSDVCRDISVTCVSASKAFNIAGLQSAAVIVPNPTLRNKVVRGLNSDEVAEPNCFAAQATIAAFDNGGPWLDELNEYIVENKRYAAERLKDAPVQTVKSEATYLMWIDCSEITDNAEKLADHLRKTTGLYISAGNQYRGNGNTFVRMNLACPRKTLSDGLDRFIRGTKSYKK